jgi:rsbT co-antagonist protein RsbR
MVAERTTALQAALAEVQARADEQALLLAELEQQRGTIREISVPVIPISATTLVMPLVGALDTARMRQVQEQAHHLILDITGVPIVDDQVAKGLLTVMEAARLLGTQVMLVGIRPEVAQAIIGLGLNLQGIYTASDLQSALKHVAGKQAADRK